eukprot:1169064-Pyramimonas_sp.AAC.1
MRRREEAYNNVVTLMLVFVGSALVGCRPSFALSGEKGCLKHAANSPAATSPEKRPPPLCPSPPL